MKNTRRLNLDSLLAAGLLIFAWFSASPAQLQAQISGDSVVWLSSTQKGNSHASIDASYLSGTDICAKIKSGLQQIKNNQSAYGVGAVIDARSVSFSVPCSDSPWSFTSPPASTILLPATQGGIGGAIVIPATWILPPNTRLIGQGASPSVPSVLGTVIQPATTFAVNTPMIQFCSAACQGVSVENLVLDGLGKTITGIANANAGDLSYVDNVVLYQITGGGLKVSGVANNSGPYSNIYFDTGPSATNSSTFCAQILGPSTHGIHGLTCVATADPPAAILLDASNNSIEDVRIVGFYDGILIGKNGSAKSNVLFNIIGETIDPCPGQGICSPPVNTVHIANALGPGTISDLTIMGVRNLGGAGTNTIEDDLTSTTLLDPSVSMYVLGKTATGGSGYTRFTTSPNAATWVVGVMPSPQPICPAAAQGSIFSDTTGSGKALWVCPVGGGAWKGIQ